MKLGVIGDIHAEDRRLRVAIEFLRARAVDRIVAVGDLVDGCGDIDRCCALLRDAGALVVRGNHDRWFLHGVMRDHPDADHVDRVDPATLRFVQSLPATATVKTPRGNLLVCHGVGDDDMVVLTEDDFGYALECNFALQQLLEDEDVRFVVAGHTHRRMVRHFRRRRGDDLVFINAGTLRADSMPCVTVVDFEEATVEFHGVEPDGVAAPPQRVNLFG